MKRLIHSLTIACCVLFGAAPARGLDTSADTELRKIAAAASGAGLAARVNSGERASFPIGEALSFHISLAADTEPEAHVVALHRDSQGSLTILVPSPLAPGARFPASGTLSISGMEAAAPLGREAVYVFATQAPLALPELAPGPSDFVAIDAADAPAFARRLALALARQDRPRVAQIEYQIVNRDQIEFTADEVYAALLPTRSVPRPRLAFHGVRFAFDSAELTETARMNLDVIGETLGRDGLRAERFALGGHTDDRGSEAYNLELSELRTRAAKGYLVERWKIDPARIETRGHGESMPAEPGMSEAARASNRRVELEVLR